MTRRHYSQTRLLAIVTVAALAAALAGAYGGRVTARTAAASAEIETVGDVRQIMRILDPSADAIWAAVSTEVTEAGVIETAPATDEDWTALETHAVALAEAGNLLLLPGRRHDEAEWVERSRQLRAAGVAALAAAKTRSPDAVLRVGEQVTSSCDACHRTYWDPDRVLLH